MTDFEPKYSLGLYVVSETAVLMIQRSIISPSGCPPFAWFLVIQKLPRSVTRASENRLHVALLFYLRGPRVSYQRYMYICLCGFTCVITRSFMCFYTPLNSVKLTAQNRNTINCVASQTYLSESHYDGVKWKKNAVSETGESLLPREIRGNWRSSRWSLTLRGGFLWETGVSTERKIGLQWADRWAVWHCAVRL